MKTLHSPAVTYTLTSLAYPFCRRLFFFNSLRMCRNGARTCVGSPRVLSGGGDAWKCQLTRTGRCPDPCLPRLPYLLLPSLPSLPYPLCVWKKVLHSLRARESRRGVSQWAWPPQLSSCCIFDFATLTVLGREVISHLVDLAGQIPKVATCHDAVAALVEICGKLTVK